MPRLDTEPGSRLAPVRVRSDGAAGMVDVSRECAIGLHINLTAADPPLFRDDARVEPGQIIQRLTEGDAVQEHDQVHDVAAGLLLQRAVAVALDVSRVVVARIGPDVPGSVYMEGWCLVRPEGGMV